MVARMRQCTPDFGHDMDECSMPSCDACAPVAVACGWGRPLGAPPPPTPSQPLLAVSPVCTARGWAPSPIRDLAPQLSACPRPPFRGRWQWTTSRSTLGSLLPSSTPKAMNWTGAKLPATCRQETPLQFLQTLHPTVPAHSPRTWLSLLSSCPHKFCNLVHQTKLVPFPNAAGIPPLVSTFNCYLVKTDEFEFSSSRAGWYTCAGRAPPLGASVAVT